jgi:DNA adenine methylase
MSILRRLGNKKQLAKKIQAYFPKHKIYIEPFFGAGGMFFNKPKAHHNIVNDLDSDVFNLFQVVMNRKEELEKAFHIMPIHSDLLEYWNNNQETDPIKKALRFLLLSNFTYLGQGVTLSFKSTKTEYQRNFKKNLKEIHDKLFEVSFNNTDCISFIKNISFKKDGRNDENKTFIYCDPPYLNTGNNYSDGFTQQDSLDLFNTLEQTKCKWAMSEYDHPFILEQAKQRGLSIIEIGERKSLKNRSTEILVTNYSNAQQSLF